MQKDESEDDDGNDVQQPPRDPSHLDPSSTSDRFSSNIFEDLFQGSCSVFIIFTYIVFQGFSKAKSKSANGGWILSTSKFLILPQLPQKIKLASKVVKVDSKIIILLPKI